MKKYLLVTLLFASLFVNANGYLGVSVGNYNTNNKVGAQVNFIVENSAAYFVGIQLKDVVTAVNGVPVTGKESLISELAKYNVDEKVTIDLLRNDKAFSITTTLGKRPIGKKYHITKQIVNDDEQWLFADDKTTITVKENKPTTVSTTDVNGKVNTFSLKNIEDVVPVVADLKDKLASIQQLRESQSACNCKCDRYYDFTFYKVDVATPKANTKNVTTLIVDKFTIAPNPTDGNFIIDFASKEKGVLVFSIVDITGRLVKAETINSFDGFYNKQINLENEAKGAYFIQFQIGDKISTKKIVLQ